MFSYLLSKELGAHEVVTIDSESEDEFVNRKKQETVHSIACQITNWSPGEFEVFKTMNFDQQLMFGAAKIQAQGSNSSSSASSCALCADKSKGQRQTSRHTDTQTAQTKDNKLVSVYNE